VALPLTQRLMRHVEKKDQVVTTGSHVLKCELHKDRISGED
jgi:hypothetical protein